MADAKALAARLRRARQFTVDFEGKKFHVRRPTDLEIGKLGLANARTGDLTLRFVDDWENVRVCDLIPGDPDQTPVDFDQELWEEFAADQPELMKEVGTKIMEAYLKHAKVEEDSTKNSEPGSSDAP